ncbi:MAG: Lrp/AsnC family transcriptional regulator [Succinivibrio sp.]
MINLDTVDLQLLCALRDDSRLSLRDLGAKVSMSAPAVASRIKRLEDSGVITGYTLSIAHDVFSLSVEAFIYVSVGIKDTQSFLSYMKGLLCVSSLYRVASEYTYMAKAAFDSVKKLNDFTLELEKRFGRTKIVLILDKEFESRPAINLEQESK